MNTSAFDITTIRWIYGTVLAIAGAVGIFLCGGASGALLWLSACFLSVTAFRLLDEGSKARIAAGTVMVIISAALVLMTKQWWSAVIFTVPAVSFEKIPFRLRAVICAAAMAAAAVFAIISNDYGRGENVLYPALLAVFFALWALAIGFVEKYIRSQNEIERVLKVSSLDSMSERQLREELAIRNKLDETNARLAERERISRDIHNSVGHTLSAASVTLDAAQIMIDHDTKKASEKMEQANSRVHEAIDSIRGVVRTLDSEDDTVLIPDYITSLKEMTSSFAMDTDIRIRHNFDSISDEGKIDISTAALVSEALKELLTNGTKHGKATLFVVVLTLGTSNIQLKVQDNGRGWGDISYEQKQILLANGFGLRKLKDHAESLGGNMEIDGSDGFSVTLDLPRIFKKAEVQ